MKNEDNVKLLSLKKIGENHWCFQTESHPSFDTIFEALRTTDVFEAAALHNPAGRDYYFINDQGLWLLSHCFSNWDELYQKITKHTCTICGVDNDLQECSFCHNWYCEEHTKMCSHCQKPFCRTCYGGHETINELNFDELFHDYGPFHDLFEKLKDSTFWQQQQADERAREETKQQQEERFYQWTYHFTTDEESDIFKSHYRTYQQSNNQHRQQTQQQETSTTIQEAFTFFGLSTRATAQEIKRKFRVLAKQGDYRHPDLGGSEANFKKLNVAYQLVLEYAQNNE